MTDKPSKHKRRSKSDRVWSVPIPHTFENVIDVLTNTPARKDDEWKSVNDYRKSDETGQAA